MNEEMIRHDFYNLITRQDVADLLGIKEKSLRYFLYKKRPENMYHSFKVLKKNGTYREISAPNNELKQIQKKLANVLSVVYEPKVCVYGFINKKTILDNARKHTRKNQVFNIDLKNFFSQIHFGRVRGMLIKAPYSLGEEAATTIAQIACVYGKLPQGAPSSPIITNMICASLDNSMIRLAKNTGCVYTRYADDITFSTFKKSFDASVVFTDEQGTHIGKKLISILEHHSFSINPEKVTFRSRSMHQEVTGLTVNEFPNLRRSYLKQIRAILHSCQKHGTYEAAKIYIEKGLCKNLDIKRIINNPTNTNIIEVNNWFKSVLKGKINYIKQIKGNSNLTYLSFAKKLNAIFEEEIFNVDSLNLLEKLIQKNTFILQYEYGENYIQGSAFYLNGFGLFTSYHVTECDEFFKIYAHTTYPKNSLGVIGKSLNEISSDKNIDYALYKTPFQISSETEFKLGDSTKLKVGDQITIIGYPDHQEGCSPFVQNCNITREKYFLGSTFFTVSGRIIHGASGGVVLNSDLEIVGIIKGGIVTLSEETDNENQGFVPLHLVIDNLNNVINNK